MKKLCEQRLHLSIASVRLSSRKHRIHYTSRRQDPNADDSQTEREAYMASTAGLGGVKANASFFEASAEEFRRTLVNQGWNYFEVANSLPSKNQTSPNMPNIPATLKESAQRGWLEPSSRDLPAARSPSISEPSNDSPVITQKGLRNIQSADSEGPSEPGRSDSTRMAKGCMPSDRKDVLVQSAN